jgi:hypothetical protein
MASIEIEFPAVYIQPFSFSGHIHYLSFAFLRLQLRYTAHCDSLWRRSAECFNVIIPSALDALTKESALLAMAETLELFFLGERQPKSSDTPNKAGLPVVPLLEISKPSTRPSTLRSSHPSEDQELGNEEGKRQDVELELAVLDTLTDIVLQQNFEAIQVNTSAGKERYDLVRRLVSIVDRCIVRPPLVTANSEICHFSHVCIRKMYVLCSRVNGSTKVAATALPLFLSRAAALLRGFTGEGLGRSAGEWLSSDSEEGSLAVPQKPRVDEIMCLLEVVASMTLVPEVVDASGVLRVDGDTGTGTGHTLAAVVTALRNRPEVRARGRERTHLLLLFPALVGCVVCKEPRVREMVRDVLALAGAELGLSIGSFGV